MIAQLILLHLLLSSPIVADEWDALEKWLPAPTNAILVIDAQSLFDSQLARANGWRETHANQFELGLTMLPPMAKQFLLATELDLQHLEPMWEFVAMSLLHPVALQDVRQITQGEFDTLGGLETVRTPRGSFVTPIASQAVALVRIAERQWADQMMAQAAARQSSVLSSFLSMATQRVAQGECQIAVAVRLDSMVTNQELLGAIEQSELVARSNTQPAELRATLASLEGLVFTIRADESLRGRLEIVFQQQPELAQVESKALILGMLETAGASLPEFANWESATGIHSLAIEGELSIAGLARVLSLLHYDTSEFDSLQANISPPQTREANESTIRYVKRVTRLMEGLARGAQSNSLNTQVLWADRGAKEIVRAIRDDVDSKVAELGYQIAYQLEGIVSTFNNATQVAQAKSAAQSRPAVEWQTELVPYSSFKTPYGRFYRYTPFSYARVHVFENAGRAAAIQNEQMNLANQRAKQKFSEITALVREMNQLTGN